MSIRKGVTLVEMMVAVVVLSVGIAGMVGTFKFFNIGIQNSKMRTLANNIAQERIEFLKNKSYYRILVTTATAVDDNFSPQMVYDQAPNGQESVSVGGVNFIRRVYVQKVNEDTSGNLSYLSWNSADTGLKEVTVYIAWSERGTWRKLELRNLINNPNRVNQSSAFSGKVTDAATTANIQGAIVRAQENPSQYGETSASGDYSFAIEPGSYTLLAIKEGYFPKSLPQLSILANQTLSGKDFALNKMSSGTITGTAYLRNHLVISQIVGSSVDVHGFSQEWVEAYNPTTWTWTMATGIDSGLVGIGYKMRNHSGQLINFDYLTLTLPPNSYYLFANTGTVTAAGSSRPSDAVYDPATTDYPNVIRINTDPGNDAASVALADLIAMTALDEVGWKTGGQSAEKYEGDPIDQAIGLELNEQYIRKTSPSSMAVGVGRAYDSNNNNNDFFAISPIAYGPKNSSNSEAPQTGTPAAGALVFSDDSLSNPVTANSAGFFNLTNVSTGSWTVYLSSGNYFASTGTFGGTANSFVASAGTTLALTLPTAYGYVSGRVTDALGVVLKDIKVYTAGTPPANTNALGQYILPASSGTVTVIANYQNQSPSYVELSSMNVVVTAGNINKDVDFSLYFGGKIRGRITTNGVDPLPNIPVTGLKGGVEQGSGISDSNGYFVIAGAGVSTGAYVVTPQLESGESCSPASSTVTLTAAGIIFSDTFTVSNAFGYIT